MKLQSDNRYIESLHIFLRNPFSSFCFILSEAIGSTHPYLLDFRGLPIWVRPNTTDLRVVRSCLLGEFEPTLDLVREEHNFIIDAGGYIGVTSILFAQRFPNSKVICIEPSTENYAIAKRNCEAWPNIEVLNRALTPQGGPVMLKDRGTGHWGFTIVETTHGDGGDCNDMEAVDSVSMDQLLERYEKKGVDLLKLDIEGGEYALLKDRPDWVDRCSVIVAELHDRIQPSTTKIYQQAMQGRTMIPNSGEKLISVRGDR